MDPIWTQHRFSGGSLALNVANTVVLRGDPERCFDRFSDATQIASFAEAAERFCAGELGGGKLRVSGSTAETRRILALRETTDALFRGQAAGSCIDMARLPPFLDACARATGGTQGCWAGKSMLAGEGAPVAFDAAVALSALSLLDMTVRRRIRICANCGWLFLDQSRNRSRLWCDMAVCGNRQKARRHYQRHRQGEGAANA